MNKKLLSENKNQKKILTWTVKSIDETNYTVEGEFSHEIEDRQGDKVIQNGWDLANYLLNPVVLWAHKHDEFPIAKMLQIGVTPENILAGKMQFAVEENPVAATAFALVKGGYLRAFSVGFNNRKYEIDQENDLYILNENELYEVSVVPVGADQLALAKQKGIDTDLLEADELKKAVAKISPDKKNIIRSAIRALTEALNDETEADKKVDTKVEHSSSEGGIKKIPVSVINRAVKELLAIKKINK